MPHNWHRHHNDDWFDPKCVLPPWSPPKCGVAVIPPFASDTLPIGWFETVAPSIILHPATLCLAPGSASGSRSLLFTLIMLTAGFGVADDVLMGTVGDGAEGGGPVGTADAFGTICGFPFNLWTSAGSAGNGFLVTGSFWCGYNPCHVNIPLLTHNGHTVLVSSFVHRQLSLNLKLG